MFTEEVEKKQGKSLEYLTFNLAGETYGLPLKEAKEIINPPRITEVPNTDDHILGLINLRGQIIPAIDLKKKLDLGEINYIDDKKITVINIRGMMLGLIIDENKEMEEIYDKKKKKVTDTKHSIKEEYIRGVIYRNNELIIVLDLEQLLFETNDEITINGG